MASINIPLSASGLGTALISSFHSIFKRHTIVIKSQELFSIQYLYALFTILSIDIQYASCLAASFSLRRMPAIPCDVIYQLPSTALGSVRLFLRHSTAPSEPGDRKMLVDW